MSIVKLFRIIIMINVVQLCTPDQETLVINKRNSIPKQLPRFWTNTGFCPIGGNLTEVLLSKDTFINIELIASLPNQGLKTIRIHWILDLIKSNKKDDFLKFESLDKLIDIITETGLYLNLEFMSHNNYNWESISYEILTKYSKKYGNATIGNWTLETWNEPDLKSYNILNFTTEGYLKYIDKLQNGIELASKELGMELKLRGPAGLFKDKQKHAKCWTALEICQNKCPFDIITFHRKGNGSSASVVEEGLKLTNQILEEFPSLKNVKFSNDEADPIVNWSIERDFQADVRYASILVETVLLHWSAIYNNRINLDSISHDNAFLSFYPYQFTQRTLLARFQINNTTPSHTQFIQKPVFVALGMLSNLGPVAYDLEVQPNWHGYKVTYLTTVNEYRKPFYLSTILVFDKQNEILRQNVIDLQLEINIPQSTNKKEKRYYIVEGLILGKTDPFYVWKNNGSPKYPKASLRYLLRKTATPLILQQGHTNNISFTIPLKHVLNSNTSVLLVRACSNIIRKPMPVFNLRIRFINSNEIILFWFDQFHSNRCIKTYQVYFRNTQQLSKWINVSRNIHTPFMSFQYQPRAHIKSVIGCYKIRSIDIFGRKSLFSEMKCL